jgi:hypothetical protein
LSTLCWPVATRAALRLAVTWLSCAAASTWANGSEAETARAAVDRARTDLAAVPPRRDSARAALQGAIAVSTDPATLAEANLQLATLDEEDGAFACALEHDRAAVVAAPGSRGARTASARIVWLGERSEGDFAPLARLTRVWHDPTFPGDAAAVEAFAREVDGFPPGVVRGEARMFVVEAWLRHLHRGEEARRVLVAVRDDPSASSQSRMFAERDLAEELLAEGQLDDAEREVGAHAAQLDASFAARVHRLVRRRAVRRAAIAELAVFGAVAAVAILLAVRRRALGLRFLPWAAFAVLCAASLVAAAFVLFDAVRPGVIEGLGL